MSGKPSLLIGLLFAKAAAFLFAGFLPVLQLEAQSDPFSSIEDNTDRWIELEAKIAVSKGEWRSEKALLESRIALLETEAKTLDETLASNEKAAELFLSNRDKLARELADAQAGLDFLEAPFSRLFARLDALVPSLPDPLQDEVRGHFTKLSGDSSASARTQSLVAALSAIDRFNNSLTLARETKPAPDGGEISAKTLYWGLTVAYAIDEVAERAWIVEPSPGGWRWTQRDEIYEKAASLIAAYEDESEDPRMLLLPVTLR